MSPTQTFVMQLLQEGREWMKLILPVFAAWHVAPPAYMNKKKADE